MDDRFRARDVCPEMLSELLGRPTGLRGNAVVFRKSAIGPTNKAFALKINNSVHAVSLRETAVKRAVTPISIPAQRRSSTGLRIANWGQKHRKIGTGRSRNAAIDAVSPPYQTSPLFTRSAAFLFFTYNRLLPQERVLRWAAKLVSLNVFKNQLLRFAVPRNLSLSTFS